MTRRIISSDDESVSEADEFDNENSSGVSDEDSSDEEDEDYHQIGNGDDQCCPICLNDFIEQQIGLPNNCRHVFCVDCILEWSKNANSCPVDRKEFHSIKVYQRFGGVFFRELAVKGKACENEDDLVSDCEICGSGNNEATLLLCDGCDKAFHCACLRPPLDAVPAGEWFCTSCLSMRNNQSSVNSHSRVVGRTNLSERVRSRISRTRRRHAEVHASLDEQLDAIVTEILLNAGERLRDSTPTERRRVSSTRKKRQRSTKQSKSGGRKKKSGRKSKSRKRTTEKKGGFALRTRASSLQDTSAFLSLSLTGVTDELDEYSARDVESSNEPSYLIAQKHRLLSRSAMRFNTPLPSLLSFGSGPSRQRDPSPPAPDVLSSIFSSQERLLAPSSAITIQRGGSLVLNSRKKASLCDDKETSANKMKNQPKFHNCAGSPSQNEKVSPSSGQQSSSREQSKQHPSRSTSKHSSEFVQHPSGSASGEKYEKSLEVIDVDATMEKRQRNPSHRERKSSNSFTLKKQKISIRPVLDLPKSGLGNRKPSDSKLPYDPFQLLDEEENPHEGLGEVYDPFEPTVSDDEELAAQEHLDVKQPPEPPDESPFKKISVKQQQAVSPDETHFDIDELLESRLDESRQIMKVNEKPSAEKHLQSSKSTKSDMVDDLDMFAEDEIEEESETIQPLDIEAKSSDVHQVKLPGFNLEQSSVVPIKFKKYSRKIKSAFAAEIETVKSSAEAPQLIKTDVISNVICSESRSLTSGASSSQTPLASEALETIRTKADAQPSSSNISLNASGEVPDHVDRSEETKQEVDGVDDISISSEDEKEDSKEVKRKSQQKLNHRQKSVSTKKSRSRKRSKSPKRSSHKLHYSSRRDRSRSRSPQHHSSKRRHRSRSPHQKQDHNGLKRHSSRSGSYRKEDSGRPRKAQKSSSTRSRKKSSKPLKKMYKSKDEMSTKAKERKHKLHKEIKRQETSLSSKSEVKKEKYKESFDVRLMETLEPGESSLEMSRDIDDIYQALAVDGATSTKQKSGKKKKEKRYSSPEQVKGSGKKKKKHKKHADRFSRDSTFESNEDSVSNHKSKKLNKRKLSLSSSSDDEVPARKRKHSKKHKREKISKKKKTKETENHSIDQTSSDFSLKNKKTGTKKNEDSVVESSSAVDCDNKEKRKKYSRISNKRRCNTDVSDAPSHQRSVDMTLNEENVTSDNDDSDADIVGTSLESGPDAHSKRDRDSTCREIGVVASHSVSQLSEDNDSWFKECPLPAHTDYAIRNVADDVQCQVSQFNEDKAPVKECVPSDYPNSPCAAKETSGVDVEVNSSPRSTSQLISENSDLDIDDLLEEPFKQLKESSKVDVKSDHESYSVHSAELGDAPDDDMRSPSPLSPSLLSPSSSPNDSIKGSQNSSMVISSQEFKETPSYAEKFLEQSRKRWENSLRNKSPRIPTTQTPDDNPVSETMREDYSEETLASHLQRREVDQGRDDTSIVLSQSNDKDTESVKKNSQAFTEARDASFVSNITKQGKNEPSSLRQSSSYETIMELEKPFEDTSSDNNLPKDTLYVHGNPSKDTDMRTFMHNFSTPTGTRPGTSSGHDQVAVVDRTMAKEEDPILDLNMTKKDFSSQKRPCGQPEKTLVVDKASKHRRSRSKSSDNKHKLHHESSSVSPIEKQTSLTSSQRKRSRSRERRRSHHEKHRKSSPKLHLSKHSTEKNLSSHQLDFSHLKSPKHELLSKFLEKTVESVQNPIKPGSPDKFPPQPPATKSGIPALDATGTSNNKSEHTPHKKSTHAPPSATSRSPFVGISAVNDPALSKGDVSVESEATTSDKPGFKSPPSADRHDVASAKEQDEPALYSPSCPISPVSLDEEDAVPPSQTKERTTDTTSNTMSLFAKILSQPQDANNDLKSTSTDQRLQSNTKESDNTLNPSQILSIVGLKPQVDAKSAFSSIAELSKQLQLGQVLSSKKTTKSSPKRRRSHKEADGLSPANIDNIESSAVALYNRDKKKIQQKKKTFQRKVVAAAKAAIKPHYARREVSKSQYKDIMKRAVNKICLTDKNMEVNEVKVRRLIRRYVERYQLKNEKGKERMRKSLDHTVKRNKNEFSEAEFLESPPSPEGSPLTAPDSPLEETQEGTPALLKKEPRQVVSLPDLPLPPPPPPPRPRTMM